MVVRRRRDRPAPEPARQRHPLVELAISYHVLLLWIFFALLCQ